MALPTIDFDKIRPDLGSQNAGFEELCAQLASLETKKGEKFVRKGPGADAGLECFLINLVGFETGWQAKYVKDWETAQPQINKSLKTALAKHPKLTVLVICVPFDLSDGRQSGKKSSLKKYEDWKQKKIESLKESGRSFEIKFCGASQLKAKLASDDANARGKILYWFGSEYFSQSWFQEKFDLSKTALGPRYSPAYNIDLRIRKAFQTLVKDPIRLDSLRILAANLENEAKRVCQTLMMPGAPRGSKKLSKTLIKNVMAVSKGIAIFLAEPSGNLPFEKWLQSIENLSVSVDEVFDKSGKTQKSATDEEGANYLKLAYYYASQLWQAYDSLRKALKSDYWTIINARAVLLFGEGGSGKSHLLADVVDYQITQGFPAILILGSQLTDAEPWRQIATQLDISGSQKIDEVLGALDSMAQAKGINALICVDALNERHGNEIWPSRLATFLSVANPYPNIRVVVSCRTPDMPFIIPEEISEDDLFKIEHLGFGDTYGQAAKRYIENRGILRLDAPRFSAEFDNPLFLTICCDELERRGEKVFPDNLDSLSELFEFYNQAAFGRVNKRLKLNHKRRIPQKSLTDFTAKSSQSYGYLPYDDATALFDKHLDSKGKIDDDLLNAFISEGILSSEPRRNPDGEYEYYVRFTFERYGDYLTAQNLLKIHVADDDIAKATKPNSPLHSLIFGDKSYMWATVIDSLAVLIPERYGIEILDLVKDPSDAICARQSFLSSLTTRRQDKFTKRTFELAKGMRSETDMYELLVSLSAEPDNPFNAEWHQKQLLKLSMPERDESWSAYLMNLPDYRDTAPINLTNWAIENGLNPINDKRARLIAIQLVWFLTTSNREIRDRATKGLAAILAVRLELAIELIDMFVSVNDPYVSERLYAAIYGAALQKKDRPKLGDLASHVFDRVYSAGRPPENLLLRDHTLNLLRFAASNSAFDIDAASPSVFGPFESDSNIERVSDDIIATYVQAYGKNVFSDSIVSSVMEHGDFGEKILNPFVRYWSPARLGSAKIPALTDIYHAWHTSFDQKASPEHKTAFKQLLEAAEKLKGIVPYPDTDEKRELDIALDTLKSKLSGEEWELFRTEAQWYVTHYMFSDNRYGNRETCFDLRWAQRWICKRAHDLGWTPDRFADLDKGRGSDRYDHRVERVGKKYQWIALYQFGAILADNHIYLGERGYSDNKKPRKYTDACNIGLRNIDPSLLVTETHYDGWKQWPKTWWTPLHATLPRLEPMDRLNWLWSGQDVLNSAESLEVIDPDTKTKWLVLSVFAETRHSEEKGLSSQTWYRVNCYVAAKESINEIVNFLSDNRLTEPSSVAHTEFPYRRYLGEFPWHSGITDFSDWTDITKNVDQSLNVRATTVDFLKEKSGYDYSLDSNVGITLPAKWLAKLLHISVADGKSLSFVDSEGETVFFDPSSHQPGPSAGLIKKDIFLDALDKANLEAFWVIAGEKNAYGGNNDGFGGRYNHTRVYRLQDDEFAAVSHEEQEYPDENQLKKYLGRKRVSKDIVSAYSRERQKVQDPHAMVSILEGIEILKTFYPEEE